MNCQHKLPLTLLVLTACSLARTGLEDAPVAGGGGGGGLEPVSGAGQGTSGSVVTPSPECEPPEQQAWWNTNWTLRRWLYVRPDAVEDELDDFPVLVRIPPGVLPIGTTAEELRFRSSDGARVVAKDVDELRDNGESLVWVRLQKLSSCTTFWMYYGNRGAEDDTKKKNVWSAAYENVWHLHEDAEVRDIITNRRASPENVEATDGVVGSAFLFDSSKEAFVDTDINKDLSRWTVTAWVRSPNPPKSGNERENGVVMREKNYQLVWDHTERDFGSAVVSVGDEFYRASFDIPQGGDYEERWYFLAGTYDGKRVSAYLDGELRNSTLAGEGGQPAEETTHAKLGRHAEKNSPSKNYFFDGRIDEVRIAREARSEAWLRASYRTVTSDMVGIAEEQRVAP